LGNLLEQARPTGTAADATGKWLTWTWPNEHTAHEAGNFNRIVAPVTLLATGTWIFGIGLATLMYGVGWMNPEEVRRQFQPIYSLLWNKWWFDELYDAIFVQPAHVVAKCISGVDKVWIDGFIDRLAVCVEGFSRFWEKLADRTIVDGSVNLLAGWVYSLGLSLRVLQTGRLRQYVMFIVVGSLAVFVLVSFFWNSAVAR
jgi:NADH-quinone oxidoreductase subunit L